MFLLKKGIYRYFHFLWDEFYKYFFFKILIFKNEIAEQEICIWKNLFQK